MNLNILYFLTFISTATSSSTVYCRFERISSFYSCNPVKVEGDLDNNNEIIVNGSHVNDFKDDDVNYIRFNSPLNFDLVPTKIFETFSNVEIFGLHSVNLKVISSNSFVNCFKLKSLHVDGNAELENLEEGFAEECSKIKNIYMSGNGLKIIDENAFRGLYNLKYLMLSKNKISNLHQSTFNHTRSLEFLFLDLNQLVNFDTNLFYPLRKMEVLSVTHNFIQSISYDVFRNNPLLDQIYFDNNHINSIEPEFFVNFPGLRDFYEYRFKNNNCTNAVLSHETKTLNEINFQICFDIWCELNSDTLQTDEDPLLEHISYEDTTNAYKHNCRYFLNENRQYSCVFEHINSVLDVIEGYHFEDYSNENVTHVFFYNSTLRKVPSIIFQEFPNLEVLSIANTQLEIINDQTFDNCGKIKKIYAGGNKISKIEESSFKNCKNLEILDLSGNPIDVADGEIFSNEYQHIILRKLSESNHAFSINYN